MYKIKIEDYKFECIIGCHDHEREKKQPLHVDLELHVLEFVDYEKVMDLFCQIAHKGAFRLIEELIDEFLKTLFKQWPIYSVKIKVNKPHALASAKNVSIEVQK